MKVALVHDWLNGMRGGEKILEVLAEIFPHAHIYTLLYESDKISSIINRLKIRTSFIQKMPFASRCYRYYLPLFPYAIERFNFKDYDLVISVSHCVAKGIKVPEHTLHICYCLTPMRYVWSFSQDYFGRGIKMMFVKPFLNYLKKWDRNTSKRPHHYLSISRYVAQRIKKYYKENSKIIYPPVDTEYFKPQDKKGDYYLIVSALVPYKKVDIAVEAFNELKLPLKIIGTGTEWSKLRDIASDNIEFLGWQSDDTVRNYYASCKAFVFPGIEDFGITVLEAQSCGRPVIAYKEGGALETVVDGRSGIFFEPQTKEALIEAVKQFEKNGTFSKETIRKNALKFNRNAFKQQLKEEIDKLYNKGIGGS